MENGLRYYQTTTPFTASITPCLPPTPSPPLFSIGLFFPFTTLCGYNLLSNVCFVDCFFFSFPFPTLLSFAVAILKHAPVHSSSLSRALLDLNTPTGPLYFALLPFIHPHNHSFSPLVIFKPRLPLVWTNGVLFCFILYHYDLFPLFFLFLFLFLFSSYFGGWMGGRRFGRCGGGGEVEGGKHEKTTSSFFLAL